MEFNFVHSVWEIHVILNIGFKIWILVFFLITLAGPVSMQVCSKYFYHYCHYPLWSIIDTNHNEYLLSKTAAPFTYLARYIHN